MDVMFLLFVLQATCAFAFLLDGSSNHGNSSFKNSEFLKVSTFLDEKNLIEQEVSKVRHDANLNFAVLTSQLQTKLNDLEKRLGQYTNQSEVITKLSEIEQKYSSLDRKFNNLQRSYDKLKQNHTLLLKTMVVIQKTSLKLENEMFDMKKLETFKPVQDIRVLNRSVHSLKLQTNDLALKEHSRSQDFLALFNMTVNATNSLMKLRTDVESFSQLIKRNITRLQDQIDENSEEGKLNIKYLYFNVRYNRYSLSTLQKVIFY